MYTVLILQLFLKILRFFDPSLMCTKFLLLIRVCGFEPNAFPMENALVYEKSAKSYFAYGKCLLLWIVSLQYIFTFVASKKPCMFWGLRSSRIVPFYRMANESLWGRIRYAYLRHFCLKNHSNYILCSNDIIRDEFIKLGIPKWRLLHREERCVEECVDNYTHASDNLTFLTIGQLRPQKHVEKCIKAFKASNLKALYNIVGRNTDDYEAYLKPLYEGVSSINRVSGFIEPHVFSQYFNAAHFVVFADEKAPSSVTNGTMLEALIHHRPIIAPNYNPYAYYIRLYGIGIQYDYNSESSFVEALRKAAFVGYKSFEKNIMRFLETISFSVSSSQFSDDVKK